MSYKAYRSLPIFGPIVDDFIAWSHHCGYALNSLKFQLGHLLNLAQFFQPRGLRSWKELTQESLQEARRKLTFKNPDIGGTIRQVQRFLEQVHGISLPVVQPPTRMESELNRYSTYLHQVCGLAPDTITHQRQGARLFLEFIDYEKSNRALVQLNRQKIEDFIAFRAKTCNRRSLQGVISCLRSFLRFQHAEGVLSAPLHQGIDAARVYALEQLPRAIPWTQVQALLRSMDRHQTNGLRDYTLIYLLAAYGLRRSEVVDLTLDDINWTHQTLRVPQRKTRQTLMLPLTDEAGDLLQNYLRKGRPRTDLRYLFLRQRAPAGRLAASAVNTILKRRIQCSGLPLEPIGPHCLRHSFAVQLLRQGVSIKTVGDTLGHRSISSTSVYLRLSIDDLRAVGLALPQPATAMALLPSGWEKRIPHLKAQANQSRPSSSRFHSGWAAALQRYLEVKQSLGRHYANEKRTLLHWDDFLFHHQIQPTGWSGEPFHLWTRTIHHLCPRVRRGWMLIVRNFLLFYARDHAGIFVPELAAFPNASAPRPPRLVSEKEMARVLATSLQLKPSPWNPLRAETIRIALILLFCCGLRRGELLRLRLNHFDTKENLLRIHETKFHKSRLVPLSDSVGRELRKFVALRGQRQFLHEEDCFLIGRRNHSTRSRDYQGAQLSWHWRHLCLASGVVDERGCPPRIHDLRHSFAACALERWYALGEEVQSKLAHLATYLGHVNAASTHYYLQLTPQLREAASQRFHQRFMPMFLKGGKA